MSKKSIPTFFTAPVRNLKNVAVVQLPKGFFKTKNKVADTVFCTFADGILQLSIGQPNITIPVLEMNKNKFGAVK